MDRDEGGLVRYWFEFDYTDVRAELARDREQGRISTAGPFSYRYCGQGVGVTGLDETDCLNLIAALVAPDFLPPVVRIVRDVDVSTLDIEAQWIGVPVWRGIWFPAINRSRPG